MTISDSWTVRGHFGDMFGAFNALVSGFAFAGIIFAIFLQREELGLQREELTLTRKEVGRSSDAQEQQIAALRVTAEMNARAALLSYYSDSVPGSPIIRDRDNASTQAQALEVLIKGIDLTEEERYGPINIYLVGRNTTT